MERITILIQIIYSAKEFKSEKHKKQIIQTPNSNISLFLKNVRQESISVLSRRSNREEMYILVTKIEHSFRNGNHLTPELFIAMKGQVRLKLPKAALPDHI